MNSEIKIPSTMDNVNIAIIRNSVGEAINDFTAQLPPLSKLKILEIAPQDHNIIGPLTKLGHQIDTLDINPEASTTYHADICKTNLQIKDESYDAVICTEVIEHVENPFAAIAELSRVLRKGGWLVLTSPFDFRIHGPLPDNWRISEHGWRVLLKEMEIVSLTGVENPDRPLMPIHYRVLAKKII